MALSYVNKGTDKHIQIFLIVLLKMILSLFFLVNTKQLIFTTHENILTSGRQIILECR